MARGGGSPTCKGPGRQKGGAGEPGSTHTGSLSGQPLEEQEQGYDFRTNSGENKFIKKGPVKRKRDKKDQERRRKTDKSQTGGLDSRHHSGETRPFTLDKGRRGQDGRGDTLTLEAPEEERPPGQVHTQQHASKGLSEDTADASQGEGSAPCRQTAPAGRMGQGPRRPPRGAGGCPAQEGRDLSQQRRQDEGTGLEQRETLSFEGPWQKLRSWECEQGTLPQRGRDSAHTRWRAPRRGQAGARNAGGASDRRGPQVPCLG